jgi:lantibiotic modifying enzyme
LNGWCHGAAGIGLARLGLLETSLGTELEATVTSDLARAKTALVTTHPSRDHLCCGGAGEVEFLLELARLWADADARRRAEARCDELAQRILAGQSPRLTGPRADAGRKVPSPGLFQGTSGVGLCLLRRAVPDLPSVLTWR